MKMNFEEYKRNLKENTCFAPGLDSINEALENLYSDMEPTSYKLFTPSTSLFGGISDLQGFSIYNSTSHKEHNHIISFGFSELYGDEHKFMRERSKFGYELTFRTTSIEEDEIEKILTAINNIYKYNKKSSIYLEENIFIDYRELIDEDSSIAGFIVTKDKELPSLDTIHGKVDFLQLHPIDCCTISTLKSGKFKLEDIIEVLEEDNPLLICN